MMGGGFFSREKQYHMIASVRAGFVSDMHAVLIALSAVAVRIGRRRRRPNGVLGGYM